MLSRRQLLWTSSALALASCTMSQNPAQEAIALKATPLPLQNIRLRPSIYADAVEANRQYLLSLSSGRLLHNFYKSADLPTKGDMYGGWEARGIAGHTLGHYLSALSLMFAQTGDADVKTRLDDLVIELAHVQAAHGDGYLAGGTVERDGEVVDGKIVFEEVRAGDIRTGGFDVNGGWVPLYSWHKIHAGLLDAYRFGDSEHALDVLLGVADYLGTIIEGLDDEQVQRLLASEFGGLNESYAETYAITHDPRWLKLARRLHHDAVLAPLSQRTNNLPGLHANTQIPKIIGAGRLHELTGDPASGVTARYFHELVTEKYTYVIGGNSDREHFGEPNTLSKAITDRTCEACNTYNMLRLTRSLYGWSGDVALFDYFERAHLNHIMAHQNPETGGFCYFMPMTSGGRRTYHEPEDSFWCCVGSGMESHSKHGDSAYWESDDALLVNLYIPSDVDWLNGKLRLSLETGYPKSETIRLTIHKSSNTKRTIALRLPGWCANPALSVNGKPTQVVNEDGYVRVTRTWDVGDRIDLRLPMSLAVSPMSDAPNIVAFLHGPMVLGADLGPADKPFNSLPPAIVATTPGASLVRSSDIPYQYVLRSAGEKEMVMRPFFDMYTSRTAVYFPVFTPEQWQESATAFLAKQKTKSALDARTVDIMYLGEMQPERDHNFHFNHADLLSWNGRAGRQAWWGVGNFMEFDLAVSDGFMELQVLYWGEEIDKDFNILIDGTLLVRERRPGPAVQDFVSATYKLPRSLTDSKSSVTLRFETLGSDAPVYEARILRQMQ